jgi:hypothetical protein
LTQNPFAEAFTAIVGGIITGVLLQVVMQKHSVLNAPLIFYASIILIAIFDYVAGIIEAHVFGFLFPITLIFFARARMESDFRWRCCICGLSCWGYTCT